MTVAHRQPVRAWVVIHREDRPAVQREVGDRPARDGVHDARAAVDRPVGDPVRADYQFVHAETVLDHRVGRAALGEVVAQQVSVRRAGEQKAPVLGKSDGVHARARPFERLRLGVVGDRPQQDRAVPAATGKRPAVRRDRQRGDLALVPAQHPRRVAPGAHGEIVAAGVQRAVRPPGDGGHRGLVPLQPRGCATRPEADGIVEAGRRDLPRGRHVEPHHRPAMPLERGEVLRGERPRRADADHSRKQRLPHGGPIRPPWPDVSALTARSSLPWRGSRPARSSGADAPRPRRPRPSPWRRRRPPSRSSRCRYAR